MPQVVPTLHQRDRIARGLITRLDDSLKADDPGATEQNDVLEMLVPFATECLTFILVRSEVPPKHEHVDLARMAIAQRMLNALPVSFGLVRRHLYIEGIAASRPLLEGALLLNYFKKRPERAEAWFEEPGAFIRLGELRKELNEEPRDPQYSWSSEYGEHVTAAGFRLIAGVDEEAKRVSLSIGGRFDESLQTRTLAVLLMSAGVANASMTDTFLSDLPRMAPRGQGALVQLMKVGALDVTRRHALQFASQLGDTGLPTEDLLAQFDALSKQYADEAATIEAAGLVVPSRDVEF